MKTFYMIRHCSFINFREVTEQEIKQMTAILFGPSNSEITEDIRLLNKCGMTIRKITEHEGKGDIKS